MGWSWRKAFGLTTPLHKAATPEDFIVNYFINAMAKNFNSVKKTAENCGRHRIDHKFEIYDPVKNNRVAVGYFDYSFDSIGTIREPYVELNRIRSSISQSYMKKIKEAYQSIAEKEKAIKVAQEKALKEMQENEAKWNIAEQLLGMKRDESGALVPVVKVEE